MALVGRKDNMKTKFYKYLIFAGFILWFGETAYFGWNDKPVNAIEKMLDIFSQAMILWGFIGDIATNLTIQKNETNNINTKSVNINGRPTLKM